MANKEELRIFLLDLEIRMISCLDNSTNLKYSSYIRVIPSLSLEKVDNSSEAIQVALVSQQHLVQFAISNIGFSIVIKYNVKKYIY